MEHKLDTHVFQGMHCDLDPYRQKPEMLVDAHNIRVTSMGEATEFALTSEKSSTSVFKMEGEYLGHCVINNYIVVFTTSTIDRIYRLEKEGNVLNGKLLVKKSLGFNKTNPIEAIGILENEHIQKVYWIDGINQPRVINIVADINYDNKPNTYFDFVNTLQLKENVYITKSFGTGYFPAGSIQYCFNYYNKYGQESNIAWVSPLLYTSFIDRAGSPEETVGNIFTINILNADTNFDYVRLYSIMRTSENALPTIRIVKDVKITDNIISISDDYSVGETIDPSSLLYIGGEEITAKTMTHKDGTLFFGNLEIKRPQVDQLTIINPKEVSIIESFRSINYNSENGMTINSYSPIYIKKHDSIEYIENTESPKTFKRGETYRLGVQFQYKTGKWSDPIFLKDYSVNSKSNATNNILNLVSLKANIQLDLENASIKNYKKIRPVIVQPSLVNQKIVAQGIICPTIQWLPNIEKKENEDEKEKAMPFIQSSWFTRPFNTKLFNTGIRHFSNPKYDNGDLLNSFAEYNSEIQTSFNNEKIGDYKEHENTFRVSTRWMTLHSPDIQFNEDLWNMDISTLQSRVVGYNTIISSSGDISITTSSPALSSKGSGFRKVSFNKEECDTLMTDFYYNDTQVNFKDKEFVPLDKNSSKYFLIYPWHKSGSLNNDCIRDNTGTRSAVLKRKLISNYKKANDYIPINIKIINTKVNLFTSDQVSLIKINNYSYYGNIDTVVSSENSYSSLISRTYEEEDYTYKYYSNSVLSGTKYNKESSKVDSVKFSYIDNKGYSTSIENSGISDIKEGLYSVKEPIRMKYKSTPHAIVDFYTPLEYINIDDDKGHLYIAELYRNLDKPYGDESENTLKSHSWIPAGDAVPIKNTVEVEWKYGDTYLQRFDCLKTYSFTNEDENSIIDVMSFMAETRVNIDGRYDKNKEQKANLNISPTNFNLINYGYNQHDNFFTYKILDDDFYKLNKFNNTITWTLEHKAAEDVDKWTNVTMASTLDLDGSKGAVNSLQTFNNEIYAFQNNGISKILFNSRVQINASDGVPIEISNNYKVDGKVYITESIGATNKWAVCKTSSGIYFIDTDSKDLYNIGGEGVVNVSAAKGMSTWFKKQDSDILNTLTRIDYDFNRNDLYIKTNQECLNYNEKFGAFISFFDYQNAKALVSVGEDLYAFTSNSNTEVWKLFAKQDPCRLLGKPYNYSISFISNDGSSGNKIFTNVDIRADWRNLDNLDDGKGINYERGLKYNFFDSMEVSNEYQHAFNDIKETANTPSNLKNRLRVWRLNIPRVGRTRISNHWAKITLTKKANNLGVFPMILHDLNVHYYI